MSGAQCRSAAAALGRFQRAAARRRRRRRRRPRRRRRRASVPPPRRRPHRSPAPTSTSTSAPPRTLPRTATSYSPRLSGQCERTFEYKTKDYRGHDIPNLKIESDRRRKRIVILDNRVLLSL